MDPVETKTNLYQVGDLLDVLDETSTWLPSQVIQVIDQDTFVVHFLLFDVKYNETINQQDLGCLQRLAPYGTHTFVNSTSTLQMNQRIEVFDMHPASNKWLKAKVIDIWENEVRVHYWNCADKFDETLPKKTRRIAPYGLNTMKTHADWKLIGRNDAVTLVAEMEAEEQLNERVKKQLEKLVELGFKERAAATALVQCNGDLGDAVTLLLAASGRLG